MATPATEFVFLPISTETTIEKRSSPAGQVWASTIETILAQEGAQRVYWGRQLETSNIVDFFVEWDSVERHKDFIASQGYKSFSKTLAGLLDGEVYICHAYFTPHAPSTALARTPPPVIEFLTFYFPSTMSDLDRSFWNGVFSDFNNVLEQHAEGFVEGTTGWVIEELHHENVEGNAVAFVALLEWESVEKHTAFRDTQQFKESIEALRNASGSQQMHHVTVQKL